MHNYKLRYLQKRTEYMCEKKFVMYVLVIGNAHQCGRVSVNRLVAHKNSKFFYRYNANEEGVLFPIAKSR